MGVERFKAKRPQSREALAAMIAAVQQRDARCHRAVATGLPAPLEQLRCGMLHEWCGETLPLQRETEAPLPQEKGCVRGWAAPLLVLSHLVRHCERGLILWIGRKVWPQPWLLVHRDMERTGDLLQRSVLLNPPNGDDRLWAIDLCLQNPAVGAVIADASGMTIAHSRRLQLAAEAGDALALLTRPARELATASAAAMRWRVGPIASPTSQPRWQIQLIRCKAGQGWSGKDAATSLVLEHDRATGDLHVPADLADRPNQASIAQEHGQEQARSTSSARRAG